MKFKVIYAVTAALSTVAVPTLAAAAPVAVAANHAVTKPVSTPLTQPASENVNGDNAAIQGTSLVLLALAIAAIAGGIAAATSNTRTTSVSP